MEGKREPLLKVVTTELAVVTAVTSKRRLARFWAFSAVDMVGSFSERLLFKILMESHDILSHFHAGQYYIIF